MNRELVILRNVTYEIRIPLEDVESIPPVVELRDMTIVNDSGPQIFIENERKAA